MAQQKYSTLAVAAFIFSILFFIPTFSVIGIIAGISALIQISKNKNFKGKWMAISAIIIGTLVTLAYIAIILFVYGFFSKIIAGVQTQDTSNSIDRCINQKPGFTRDMCVLLAISANINQTGSINNDTCDLYVQNTEIKDYCNAVVRKDKSYCYNITSSDSRIKCLGLIDEINRKANK